MEQRSRSTVERTMHNSAEEVRLDKKVYVVDDDPLVLDIVCGRLRGAGYDAEPFSDPVSFVAAAPTLVPGCVVLDLDMPGLSGREVQDSLLRMNLPFEVIFYTGHGSVRKAVEGLRAGAGDFLQKSDHLVPLLEAVKTGHLKLARDRNRSL